MNIKRTATCLIFWMLASQVVAAGEAVITVSKTLTALYQDYSNQLRLNYSVEPSDPVRCHGRLANKASNPNAVNEANVVSAMAANMDCCDASGACDSTHSCAGGGFSIPASATNGNTEFRSHKAIYFYNYALSNSSADRLYRPPSVILS